MPTRALLFVCLSLALAAGAEAQTTVAAVPAGACVVKVELAAPAANQTTVELQINKKPLEPVAVEAGKNTASVVLRGPLRAGDELRATRSVGGKADPLPGPAIIVPEGGSPQCAEDAEDDAIVGDGRDTFDASAYVGVAVDNFSPASVGGYADPEAGGKQTRAVAGFDFEFRLAGTPESRRQLWIFGETLHGVRSADINCQSEKDRPAVCDPLTLGPGGNAGKQAKYILENATSMEAYVGFRYEFLTLQASSTAPVKLYATARLGVMMLNGEAKSGPGDAPTFKANHAYDTHHVGIGLLMPSGPDGKFAGSLLEVGWGVTELFNQAGVKSGWRRLKIDGLLSYKLATGTYAFAQVYSDFDPRDSSADSVQTFYGISFSPQELFR